ncbi:MAG: Bacterial regulatory protein luxR family [Planctomycetota bacterium]|jgi:DNA-binding CsgD family transcriptional regulator
MKPVVLKLSDPKVASIYSDFPLMQRWEMLRRSEEPLTPTQLAQVCRTSVATVQHGLDQLQAAGLVVRLKASARSRQIKYRVVSTSLIFEYDEQSEEQRRRVADQREALKQYGRRCIDRAHTTRLPAEQFLGYWTTDITTILTKAEAREIRDVMIGAGRAIGAIEHRARARLKSEAAKSSEPPPAPSFGWYIRIQLQQLVEPELPIPAVTATDTSGTELLYAELAARPDGILSPRELEVARLLAAGTSRPKIAESLGLAKNTVATMSKRIYSKLKVHSRAELVARVKPV